MTAIEQRHREPDCHDVEVADDRAAMLAALSDELTERLSKHPPPPRRHTLEGKRSRWPAPWRIGLLSALGVAVCLGVVGLMVTPSGIVWNELERARRQPADPSRGVSSIMAVSTAASATASAPQAADAPLTIAPPTIAPPTIIDAPAHDLTPAAPQVDDPPRVDERELTWTEIHELQIRLRALKFDPGPMDGVKGPLTSAAVRRFQESQGDRATGDIGLRTLIRVRQATAAPE